jgi:modulator of FtsH protease HflC
MKRNPLTLAIGVLLILIVVLLLFVFQVRKSEVVVVTTFGKPTRTITEPGANFKWPWPIQNYYRFDQRVQNFEDKLNEGLTQDSFNLLSSVYVGWRITDASAFFPKFAGSANPTAEAERVLERLTGNAKTAVIGKHPLSDLLSPDSEGNKFAQIENEILETVRPQVAAHNYGLEIVFLEFKRLGLPEAVTQEVFGRMTSERQVLINKSQYEGEAEASKIRSEADRRAAELLATADAQAVQIRGRAEAEAAASLEVFQRNPELANFIFSLNALESSLRERTNLILDQNTVPFDLFRGGFTNLTGGQPKAPATAKH